MTPIDDFIKRQLDISRDDPPVPQRTPAPSPQLAAYLYSLVVRSEFRRTALDQETVSDIHNKIHRQMAGQRPIQFSIPFGAYKNWRLRSSPELDWAEVFNLNYLIRYVLPISVAYNPGVLLQYSYNDHVMDRVSNIPLEHQRRYVTGFQRLLSMFQSRLPPNIVLNLVRINDFYSTDAYATELEQNYASTASTWLSKYPSEVRARKIASAHHNLMLNGVRNLARLPPEELNDEYVRAAMWCDAVDCLKERRRFNKYADNIQLVFVRGPTLSLHVGVCDTGSIHFWAGTGIAEVRKDRILQRILSRPNLDSLANTGSLASVCVSSKLATVSANLQELLLWNNPSLT